MRIPLRVPKTPLITYLLSPPTLQVQTLEPEFAGQRLSQTEQPALLLDAMLPSGPIVGISKGLFEGFRI